jgi:transcriptional regulator with XRE-family HTH domain
MTRLESASQKEDWGNYSDKQPVRTNLYTRDDLLERIRSSRDARIRFVESNVDKKLAFQIRSLRGDLSQQQMQEKVGIKQQVISRLENPYYGKATISTLKRIAAAFDVGLIVEFVPFSQLVNRVAGLTPEDMPPPSFEEEKAAGTLDEQLGEQPVSLQDVDVMLSTPIGGTDPLSPFLPKMIGNIKTKPRQRMTRRNPRRRLPKGTHKDYARRTTYSEPAFERPA